MLITRKLVTFDAYLGRYIPLDSSEPKAVNEATRANAFLRSMRQS